MPCVPGKSCKTKHLENLSGSSEVTPAAALPAVPTPIAEPMPAIAAANTAPMRAIKVPSVKLPI